MKVINIYVLGSYDSSKDSGKWTYYIEYKGAIKKGVGVLKINAQSANKIMLVALVESLNAIKEPCHLVIKAKTSLGFANINKSKNKWILERFVERVQQCGHTYEIDENPDFSVIKQWEDAYGKK